MTTIDKTIATLQAIRTLTHAVEYAQYEVYSRHTTIIAAFDNKTVAENYAVECRKYATINEKYRVINL